VLVQRSEQFNSYEIVNYEVNESHARSFSVDVKNTTLTQFTASSTHEELGRCIVVV